MAYRTEPLGQTFSKSSGAISCDDYSRSNSQPGSQVGFFSQHSSDKKKEEKKKYLTQKYGREQIMLIKKRLDVEEWMLDNLRILYKCMSAEEDHSCEMDVDDLLDLESDQERRAFVQEKVADAKQPPGVVDRFINELLEKLKTL